ncbi:branched-chain amino acid ABC transporter permease [Aliihoeflea sp. 40Bstr573]|uniref:branched-chain amino acid ABC transporter permease n=1 Tax=Aliihoeflea sp. 40Bstr573 TaxID=2696467 RepID=UPI002094A226|nr:branched-chain amino acid ABC transporter permease [Aliihoeflea sp. 40Bstr573]
MIDFLNALVMFANFVFLPGLAYGAQLALGALGITLVFGILRFSNFAHGDLMAFGTMITILVTWWLIGMGVTLGPLPTALLALPIGIIGAVIMALIIDRTVFRFYRQQHSASIVLVMASVGVMFMLNGIVRLVIGPNDQRFADGERFLITVREFREWTGLAEGLAIRLPVAITVVVAVVVVVALFWFLTYSRTGKAMRAYSDNEDLALLSGINPDKVVRVTWVIAAALATIAGVLYGLDKSFRPFTYFQLLLPMFAAAIVGGIGQPIGAIAGGFVVAFSEVTLTYAYKRVLEYMGFAPDGLVQLLSTEYKFAISFVILVIVLLIRPTGIFRGRVL